MTVKIVKNLTISIIKLKRVKQQHLRMDGHHPTIEQTMMVTAGDGFKASNNR